MTRLPTTVDDLRGLRAARWIRESTAGQYDRYGPEVQGGQIAAAIRRLGLVDTGLAWSPAHSGSTVHGSPAMRAMLEAAGAGAFDVLVVARSDRWQRNLRQTLNLLEDDLHAVGVVVWFDDERAAVELRAELGPAGRRGEGRRVVAAQAPTPRPRGLRRQARRRRATRAAGRPSGSGATPRRSSSSRTRTACPWSCAPSSSRPTAGPTARSPRRRACRCSPSGGCSPARSTSAGCGRASGRTGRRSSTPPLWEAVQAVRATRRTRDGRPAVVRRPYALTMLHCAGCGRHLIGDTGPLPAPGPVRGVHRRPPRAPEAQPRPAHRDARPLATARRSTRRSSATSSATCRWAPSGSPRSSGPRGTPEPDRLALARIGRERDAALARYRRDRDLQALEAAMAALDEQEAEARDRQPAPELSAAEVVAYLRDLPRLWDEAPDSRRALTESLFERVEVLGLRRMHLEPTPAAIAAGLVEAFFAAHLLVMVGARGFEPPTSSSRTMRATKLRHAPTEVLVVQSPGIVARAGRDRHAAPGRTGGRPGARASPQARARPLGGAGLLDLQHGGRYPRPPPAGPSGAAMHHLGTFRSP